VKRAGEATGEAHTARARQLCAGGRVRAARLTQRPATREGSGPLLASEVAETAGNA